MLYAARNLPKDHTLLLVHGVHSWMGKSISERDKPDILELEDHYESLCKRAGRDCKFKHFSYTSTSGFGDEVCRVHPPSVLVDSLSRHVYQLVAGVYVQIADKKGAASVVIGRRENVSGMRRYATMRRVCACAGLTSRLALQNAHGLVEPVGHEQLLRACDHCRHRHQHHQDQAVLSLLTSRQSIEPLNPPIHTSIRLSMCEQHGGGD